MRLIKWSLIFVVSCGIRKYAQLSEDSMVQRFLCFSHRKENGKVLKVTALFHFTSSLHWWWGKTWSRHYSQGRSWMSLRFFINAIHWGGECLSTFYGPLQFHDRNLFPSAPNLFCFTVCLPVWLAGQGRSSSSHEYSGLQITQPQRNVIVLLRRRRRRTAKSLSCH